jgi:hypothetical protein
MIYPKDFNYINSEIEENSAFVIMPFDAKFDEIFGVITDVCIKSGITSKRADSIFDNRPIIENILSGITKSEIIIADLTDKNANVYYEVGIAHSLRDQDSIILMAQSMEDIPFDIKHWPILLYDNRNLFQFRTNLKHKIEFCKTTNKRKNYIKNFLRNNGIKGIDINDFMEKAEQLSVKKFEIMGEILQGTSNLHVYGEKEINGLLSYFMHLEELESGKLKRCVYLIKLNVFSSDSILLNHTDLVKELLLRSKFDLIHTDDIETFNFIADYCMELITKQKFKKEAIGWLTDYLHNYRMGRIDIVRTKIEAFFVRTDNYEINSAILQMLDSKTITVRESAADICGQKILKASIQPLMKVLSLEENPHVARSCMTALTKLSAKEAVSTIFAWMKDNTDKWGEKAVSASLKNIALSALKELDGGGEHYKQFKLIAK